MDVLPILARVAELLERQGLEVVLIGNAAAALQGAPVTTVDLDFMFRRTPANVRKLTAVAAELGAMLMKPHYPVSGLLRISRDDDGLQLDFMGEIHGVRSFEGLKSRAHEVRIGEVRVWIASLADIIKSKKAAGRPRDLAVLGLLEKALEEASRHPKRPVGSS
jgi:predicted nucleotidyltransferase